VANLFDHFNMPLLSVPTIITKFYLLCLHFSCIIRGI